MRLAVMIKRIVIAGALWFGLQGAAEACIGLGCNCTVSAQDVAFGGYDPLASSPDLAVGQVTVDCGAQVAVFFSYDVKLSSGGGTYAARRMTSGANQLSYQLYTDSNRTAVWGDGAAGTSYVSLSYTLSVSLLSRTDNFAVYGRAPALQNVKPGAYTDSILVTLTF